MREQEQLTFYFKDSSPLASRHVSDRKVAGGERGRTNIGSDYYWSSTTYAGNTDNAWNVNFNNGNVNNNNPDKIARQNEGWIKKPRGLIDKLTGVYLFRFS